MTLNGSIFRLVAGVVAIVCGVITFLEGNRVVGVGLTSAGIGLLL